MVVGKFFKNNFHIIFITGGIVLLVILLYYKSISTQSNQGTGGPRATSFMTYVDPAKHYEISVPAGWATVSGFGNVKTGIGTDHEATIRSEVSNLFSGEAGLNISVYEGAPNCDKIQKPNTTIAGVPAYFDAGHYAWIINTTNSTIVAGYYFPGAGVYHKRFRSHVLPPSSEMFANQGMVNEIISTLKLQKAKALECP